jgi:hypothetical protein
MPEVTVPQPLDQTSVAADDARFSSNVTQDYSLVPSTRNPQAIDWSHGLPSVAVGGMVGATLMIFPLGAFGLGMLAAGAMAAYFYHRRSPASELTAGIGAKLGALSGVFGFSIFAIFAAAITLLAGTQKLRDTLLQAVNQSAARTTDPQTLQAFEYFKTPPGLAIILVIGLVFLFLMFLVLSTVGGALGAAWIRRRRRSS